MKSTRTCSVWNVAHASLSLALDIRRTFGRAGNDNAVTTILDMPRTYGDHAATTRPNIGWAEKDNVSATTRQRRGHDVTTQGQCVGPCGDNRDGHAVTIPADVLRTWEGNAMTMVSAMPWTWRNNGWGHSLTSPKITKGNDEATSSDIATNIHRLFNTQGDQHD
jgi:hypothetical protein